MDFAGTVQSIGRTGESIYAYSTPNYSPIQAVPPVRGGQGSFSQGNGNNQNRFADIYKSNQLESDKSKLSSDYRLKAQSIQNDAKSHKQVITPGMLLDIIA
ncbi:MAG: hypothetical protein JJT78_09950 [Leptospira sp.]|nr:hypothetical protein [Leptospira sp.]